MWTALARRAIAEFARGLPRRAQKVLLRELCSAATPDDAYAAFQILGKRYGIADIRVPGNYGLIDGALADTVILATYAKTRRWAGPLSDVVGALFDARGAGTYVDVGANIGLTTIPVARHGLVKCKAFEPEPRTFRYLLQNVSRNCAAGNVDAFNVALSDRRGTIAFELADDNLGDNRMRFVDRDGSFGEAQRPVIDVQTERLDDVLGASALTHPLVVKIDTQGAECRVVAGGRATMDAAEMFAFEFWPYGIRRMGDDPAALIEFVGGRFSVGALIADAPDASVTWRPIRAIAEQLAAIAGGGDAPYATCDVVVRR